jgi:hypothetical protein
MVLLRCAGHWLNVSKPQNCIYHNRSLESPLSQNLTPYEFQEKTLMFRSFNC